MTGENACGEYTVVTADTGVLKEGNWYVAEGNVTLGDIDAAGKELCRNYLYRMRRMNSSVQGVCAAIHRKGGRRAGAR